MRSVFQIRPYAGAAVLADLVAQPCLEHGDLKFFLAEQGEFAAVFQPEEVGQPGRGDGLDAEPGRVIAEHGAGQDIPSRAMGAGAIEVGHFRQHAGRWP